MARPYQVKEEQLTQAERDHLWNVVFPLTAQLSRVARERIEARKRAEQAN